MAARLRTSPRFFFASLIALGLPACGDKPAPVPSLSQAAAPAKPPVAPAADVKAQPAPVNAPGPTSDPNKDLAARVKEALERGSRANARGIDVSAENGVVRLWGTVATAKARKALEKIATATAGVSKVENKIVVVKGS